MCKKLTTVIILIKNNSINKNYDITGRCNIFDFVIDFVNMYTYIGTYCMNYDELMIFYPYMVTYQYFIKVQSSSIIKYYIILR